MKLELLTEDEQKRLRTMTQAQWALIERLTDALASARSRKEDAESKLLGMVNGIRSLVLFHTKNGTMHGDCASDFAELVAPYPYCGPSGEVINEVGPRDLSNG